MSSTRLEPRLAERRRRVKEETARGNLARSVLLLMSIALLGAGVWLLQSPLLAVDHILVSGAARADLAGALRSAGLREGMPLVAVRAGRVEASLAADPWVVEAHATVVLPDTVEIVVSERTPLAKAPTPAGWMLVGGDGVVLGPVSEGDAGLPALTGEVGQVHPGEALEGEPRAAVEFLEALPEEWRAATEVRWEAGFLWATIAGRQVRLGDGSEPAAKASAVAATLSAGVPEGATVDVLAPGRPAVRHP